MGYVTCAQLCLWRPWIHRLFGYLIPDGVKSSYGCYPAWNTSDQLFQNIAWAGQSMLSMTLVKPLNQQPAVSKPSLSRFLMRKEQPWNCNKWKFIDCPGAGCDKCSSFLISLIFLVSQFALILNAPAYGPHGTNIHQCGTESITHCILCGVCIGRLQFFFISIVSKGYSVFASEV